MLAVRRLLPFAVVLLLVLTPAGAPAQTGEEAPPEPVDCGTYEGLVCRGWVTDEPGVVGDTSRLTQAVERVIAEYGHQIAVVVVSDSRGRSPLDFADEIGNAWGVGDPERNDGIVVLVDIDARETWVTTGPGVSLDAGAAAGAGDSFFRGGDFEGGLLAIVGAIEQQLDGGATTTTSGDGGTPATTVGPEPDDEEPPAAVVVAVLAAAGVVGGGVGLVAARRRRRERTTARRAELVDGELDRLEATGAELPRIEDYAVVPADAADTSTGDAVLALRSIADGTAPPDSITLNALWYRGAILVVARDRLIADTTEPLELRASQERPILEEAVQQAARDALAVPPDDDAGFDVRRQDLVRIVDSLRPHRVAAARRRTGVQIADGLVDTAVGPVAVTDLGHRLERAGAALDAAAPLADSLVEMDEAYRTAVAKTGTLEALYDKLPDSTARPAVAAALADLDDDQDAAYLRYEKIRSALEDKGDTLERDGLSIPAVAALLLMNRDEDNVDEFLAAYRANRSNGFSAAEAVEYALAGLADRGEIEAVRREADRLGLPVSITAALLRRRDDGPEVYQELADALAAEGITGDTRKTVAGILAVSLEPAQAMRRYVEARSALAGLGLEGSYADVAAAFGASDPRGPRRFALAYAAQRQALARSKIKDADRFAPELAHDGTRRQTDSWTGKPIPADLRSFDPFTLLFYHWVITQGARGSYGWEPVYRDRSWSGDRGSWWGGGGGFGRSGGGSWGGSSWGGGGGFSGGGFGGFSGGGGFGGGSSGGGGW